MKDLLSYLLMCLLGCAMVGLCGSLMVIAAAFLMDSINDWRKK